MSRFGSNVAQRPTRRETYASQHRDPSEGHPQDGVPDFPDALPGSHHYGVKPEVPLRHTLDVGPAEPYYSKGMAHGVRPEHPHGGRPAPRPEDRGEIAASRALVEAELRTKPDPVPVYLVETGGGAKPLKRAAFRQVIVPTAPTDPIVLVPRNPRRSSVRVLNEGSNPVRLTFDIAASGGALLPAGMTGYLEIDTEDEICAYVAGASNASAYIAGTATTPVAGQAIATLPVLPAGLYTISGAVHYGGTVETTTINNFQLQLGSTVLVSAIDSVDSANGAAVPFRFLNVASDGVHAFSINARANASAGATYIASLQADGPTGLGSGAPAPVSVIEQYDVPAGG